MGEHALRRDGVAAQDIETERFDRPHLGFGEIRIVEIVTGIMDLDADRTGIDVGLAGPEALAGVPSALRLRDELRDAPVLVHR